MADVIVGQDVMISTAGVDLSWQHEGAAGNPPPAANVSAEEEVGPMSSEFLTGGWD